jgi:mRNA-degrading endonuclease toxin of MazEF toxin-antitoxin module
MKYKIVLINFPFDDLANAKLRPALCLTDYISRFNHIIFAAITSNVANATELTDIIIEVNDETTKTGLKTTSVLKTHRLITASENVIQKIIGELPLSYHPKVVEKLMQVFKDSK